MSPARFKAARRACSWPQPACWSACGSRRAALLLLVQASTRGVKAESSTPTTLEQLQTGAGCITAGGGSICAVPEEHLEGFADHPTTSRRLLLAGGMKRTSSPGAHGPALGDAARSVAVVDRRGCLEPVGRC
eukprot:CAMPEP_0119071074 /NCGR_PEP_ID=MMETSP1178-20130426/48438_1 /TAXON_ID=33656 /ORGANISM="unid sp, Strain CCMP2000" /LENGTH=131 /DNA_ID=CAMNT_0007052971 /DNA_START=141 /DNA_END=533 /DNA_ORIENTATION=-